MKDKPKLGRPAMGLVAHTVGLTPKHWAKAKKLGKGNKARGLRVALDKSDDFDFLAAHATEAMQNLSEDQKKSIAKDISKNNALLAKLKKA